MRYAIILLFGLIVLNSCGPQPDKQHQAKVVQAFFEKRGGNYCLSLNRDSTYLFEYPDFLGPHTETGNYHILDQSLWLKRVEENRYDDVVTYGASYVARHLYKGQLAHNDSLEFYFTNLNDSSICVTFRINQNSTRLKTDSKGYLKLPYRDLVRKNIISTDSMVNNLTVIFGSDTYFINAKTRKPAILEVQLNQYKGEETVTMYRQFQYLENVIIMNGMERKFTGKDDSLKLK